MFEKVTNDIKGAMKSGNKDKLNALRYLKSMLIENKTSTDPKPELEVVINYCKKLKDSMESYPAGSEAITRIQAELTHLKPYLPEQMSKDEVQALIKKIAGGLPSPNMGAVMKELSPAIKGKFDGKEASQMVKDFLA